MCVLYSKYSISLYDKNCRYSMCTSTYCTVHPVYTVQYCTYSTVWYTVQYERIICLPPFHAVHFIWFSLGEGEDPRKKLSDWLDCVVHRNYIQSQRIFLSAMEVHWLRESIFLTTNGWKFSGYNFFFFLPNIWTFTDDRKYLN